MGYLYQPFPIWGSGSIREKLTRLYELEERKESVKCLLDVVWLLDTSPYRSCGCLHNTYKDQVIDNSSIVVRTWSKGNTHCWWKWKLAYTLWKSVHRFCRNIGIDPPQDPSILFLDIYPKDVSSCQRDTWSNMFIDALLIITKIWKLPRCSSISEYKKMWQIYTMEYNLANKKMKS